MTCSKCGEEFRLLPGKPGYANVCQICTDAHPPKEPDRLMATVAWSGKHTVEVNITTPDKAIPFNRLNGRRGHGPNLRFSPQSSSFGEKDRDSNVIGTEYRTRLGESRKVILPEIRAALDIRQPKSRANT